MGADGKTAKPGWTEERVEQLKKLWSEGLSASKIADLLGGVTRNAVIGKMHRLRKSGEVPEERAARPKVTRKKTSTAKAPTRPVTAGATALKAAQKVAPERQVNPKPELKLAELPDRGSITNIMDLTQTTCRWPIGDPGEEGFAYCGARAPHDSPYCEHHARIAYQPAGGHRRKASG